MDNGHSHVRAMHKITRGMCVDILPKHPQLRRLGHPTLSTSTLDPISAQLNALVSAVTGFGSMLQSVFIVQQAENQPKITSVSPSSFCYMAKVGILVFLDNIYKGRDLTKIPMNVEKWHWCCPCVQWYVGVTLGHVNRALLFTIGAFKKLYPLKKSKSLIFTSHGISWV